MLKKILFGLAGLVVLLVVGAVVAYVVTGPEAPGSDTRSAHWLKSGPHTVSTLELVLVDDSRPTAANGEYPGTDNRTFVSQIWFPEAYEATHPLVVYSHGFMSNKLGGEHYAERLASYGYVVVAADYPLTNGQAPGGPNVADVVNQAEDVSFLIDSVLALAGEQKPFAGEIDVNRIGVTGISLGGLTSTLAGYHPRWRDRRIQAVASIAGPASMFTETYYQNAAIPFLMIAGTVDAIVEYVGNADVIPRRAANGALVTIDGGSHLGFVSIAEPMMRSMSNPDSIGCTAILANIETEVAASSETAAENPFAGLGTVEEGIDFSATQPGLCSMNPLPESIHPGRQHMITQVALLSFFESQFAADAGRRDQARDVLAEHLSRDFSEARVTGSI